MDPRLQIADEPRPLATDVTATTPLLTVVWRTLHAEYQARRTTRDREERDAQRLRDGLAALAETFYRVRRLASRPTVEADALRRLADQLEDDLRKLGLGILAPTGEPFDAEWPELFENVAQQPEPNAHEPRIAEVITPAIFYRGQLVRMGQVVVGIPPLASESSGEGSLQEGEQAAEGPSAPADLKSVCADAENQVDGAAGGTQTDPQAPVSTGEPA